MTLRYLLVLSAVFYFITGCKDKTQQGCTDPAADNYNFLADEDDGSCVYSDSIITLWNNGKAGVWGSNPATGSIIVSSCYSQNTTILLNPDTLITPADTLIDTTMTPPDTTIIPADTTVSGIEYLLVEKDSNGYFEIVLNVINNVDGRPFGNGYLTFDAYLPKNSDLQTFEVFIHGKSLIPNTQNLCNEFYESGSVGVSTAALDTIFRNVTIPLIDFKSRYLQNMNTVFGLKGKLDSGSDTVLILNNIKWVQKLD